MVEPTGTASENVVPPPTGAANEDDAPPAVIKVDPQVRIT